MSRRCNGSNYDGGDSMDKYPNRIQVMDDFFPVPQVHRFHDKKPEIYEHRQIEILQANVHHHQAPETHKKVHFTEKVKIVGNDTKGKRDDKTVDVEADGFIQQQHRSFESYNTLKGY